MTVQEAIDVLKIFTTDEFQKLTSSEFDDAINCAIKSLEKQRKIEELAEDLMIELNCNCYWTQATFDEDGYSRDDSQEVVSLERAIEIVKGGGVDA